MLRTQPRALRLAPALVMALLVLGLAAVPAAMAANETPHRFETHVIDSGDVRNTAESGSAVIYEETVRVEGAPWLRLYFDRKTLAVPPGTEAEEVKGAMLRITSLFDGAQQIHTRETLERWRYSSAFFNGDEIKVEMIAEAGAPASRVRVFELMVGERSSPEESICGATDDRVLSSDPRIGRLVPVGCTAWFYDNPQNCMLTAGHCIGDNTDVVEFNVPLSLPDSTIQHPDPQHQYPLDFASIQFTPTTTIGNDWGVFGAFPNGVTNITPYEAQGSTHFVLTDPPLTPGGEMIRITGNGSTTGTQGTPLEWYLVQTTHVGPLTSVSGTILQYSTDTTGGDSGSAIHIDGTDQVIGIHTNAGCSAGGGANNGMSLANTGLQDALAAPIGICADGPVPLKPVLTAALPNPLPEADLVVEFEALDRNDSATAINGANLVYDAGGGDQTVAFANAEGGLNLWQATLPEASCGDEVTVRVDVEATDGTTVYLPFTSVNSPDRRYTRTVGAAWDRAFYDDMETDMGWTVDNDAELTAGAWERGFPAGYGLRNDPPWDADGSGMAFITDPHGGNTDVDGGATRLLSPTMDATLGGDPHISYWRWYSDEGSANLDDPFVVELSNDNGGTWTTLESIGPNVTGEWVKRSYRISTLMTPTNQMRLRFTAADAGDPGVIEASVDGVALTHGPTGILCSNMFSDDFESGGTGAWSSTIQ